jgi:hypothetical protein
MRAVWAASDLLAARLSSRATLRPCPGQARGNFL